MAGQSKHPDAKNLHKASLISFNGKGKQNFQEAKLGDDGESEGPPALNSERKLVGGTPGEALPKGDK